MRPVQRQATLSGGSPCLSMNRFAAPHFPAPAWTMPATASHRWTLIRPGLRVVLISEVAPRDPGEGYYGARRAAVPTNDHPGLPRRRCRRGLPGRHSGLGRLPDHRGQVRQGGLRGPTGHDQGMLPTAGSGDQAVPSVRAWLLMGDVAIQAVNAIAKQAGQSRVIPAGSTYKVRGPEYWFRGARAFPVRTCRPVPASSLRRASGR